ncbi:MAG: heme exporter protein CcmD [Pseudomonadota bacterium]
MENATFVMLSYGAAGFVTLILLLWVMLSARHTSRELARLEAQTEAMRRSDR